MTDLSERGKVLETIAHCLGGVDKRTFSENLV